MRKIVRTLFFLSLFSIPNISFSAHLLGGSITWECVTSGSDQGKFIFELRLYAACYQGAAGLGGTTIITNSLYAKYGGPSTISLNHTSQKDLTTVATSCFDSAFVIGCGLPFSSSKPIPVIEHIYTSDAVGILGIPEPNGSPFTYSSCCRPASQNVNGQNGYSIQSSMFPYIDPVTNSPRSLGSSASGPTCYDSSPKFAQSPTVLACLNQNINFDYSSIDFNNDSIVYDWKTPFMSSTQPITWKTGYNDSLQLPNANHNASNIGPVMDKSTGFIDFNVLGPNLGYHHLSQKITSYKGGQKVSEVHREIAIQLMNCDSLSLTTIPPLFNAGPPSITMKEANAGSFLPSYSGTFPLGSTIEMDIRALDLGFLPTNPLSIQSVSLEMSGSAMSASPNDSLNCAVTPCAYLDSNNIAWNNGQFYASSIVAADFTWNTACENMKDLISRSGGVKKRTFIFNVKSKDNWCPLRAESNAQFDITLVDTASSSWPLDTLDASNGGAYITWPQYSGSNFSSYEIYRTYNLSAPWTYVASESNIQNSTFRDTLSLTDSIPVYYLVEINNGPSCYYGYKVSSIHLKSIKNPNNIMLWWNKPYTDSTFNNGKYHIYRKTSASPWTLIDSTNFGFETYFDPSFVYNDTNFYKVLSSDIHNLNTTSNITKVFVDSTTPPVIPGFEELNLNNVSIYPNPAVDRLFVEFEYDLGEVQFVLYTPEGKTVKAQTLSGINNTLDISDLKEGLYFLNIQSLEIGNVSHKVLISR